MQLYYLWHNTHPSHSSNASSTYLFIFDLKSVYFRTKDKKVHIQLINPNVTSATYISVFSPDHPWIINKWKNTHRRSLIFDQAIRICACKLYKILLSCRFTTLAFSKNKKYLLYFTPQIDCLITLKNIY